MSEVAIKVTQIYLHSRVFKEVAIKVTQIYLHSRVFKGYSKDMIVSDCLSRSSLQQIDCKIENEVNLYVDSVSAHMPISDTCLKMIYNAT